MQVYLPACTPQPSTQAISLSLSLTPSLSLSPSPRLNPSLSPHPSHESKPNPLRCWPSAAVLVHVHLYYTHPSISSPVHAYHTIGAGPPAVALCACGGIGCVAVRSPTLVHQVRDPTCASSHDQAGAYMYIHLHAHAPPCTYTHMPTCTSTCTSICTCTSTRTCTAMYTCTSTCTCTATCTGLQRPVVVYDHSSAAS